MTVRTSVGVQRVGPANNSAKTERNGSQHPHKRGSPAKLRYWPKRASEGTSESTCHEIDDDDSCCVQLYPVPHANYRASIHRNEDRHEDREKACHDQAPFHALERVVTH